ncbi:tRNA dimethylallyltransferase [Frondihabitans sp. PhB188]|uniref:tRNA (adenosine(37)-N6)-dimethylallyltransferase MiaA n=1 Tax=Frondihabitans sp. PhB188 TaxID=2485200 RepID=UPI000FBB4CF3|nr:tRNA (adenosine(37)-N6)-dimethylallyltransferase MiaA [Frondihabitans sp. PhB188]ROQ38174.1 tRNA dimethylallyltransferase [Frondihabitans sp. PhB188]
MTDSEHPDLAVVVGATGTGKSAFALDLADELGRRGRSAEVVNADAMQLYQGMDIGTAKLPPAERRGVPHHLFDELQVSDEASVEWYQQRARDVVDEILGRGAVAILVGGSGLYVSGAVFDFRFPGTDAIVRERYERLAAERGTRAAYDLLKGRDPAAALAIGPHNARRIVRALEVGEITGEPFAVGLPEDAPLWRPAALVGLRDDRDVLVERLDGRVDDMWRQGLVAEVEGLLAEGPALGVTASRAIGYAQAIAEIRGELTETEARDLTKQLTRRYARRQVSWFKRYPRVTWVESRGDLASAVSAVADTLTG